jgi:CRISPR/Cas system CSM-associated protein Csm4 (group 5 of RAMP superfamily)
VRDANKQALAYVYYENVTIGGYVKDTVHADRVELNSAAVVNGDIFHRTLVIEGSDASLNRHAQSCAGTYRDLTISFPSLTPT